MFRKLLNVGKGHSGDRQHHHHQHQHHNQQQQQQLQQKDLFQLNEIKSYGFSHFGCLGYSPSLSLLAVGSKNGLVRVFGNPSVEFSYQLESANSIRQIEFIDCRDTNVNNNNKDNNRNPQASSATSAKLVVLTDNGQLHLFELKTIKQLNYVDNTTQTDVVNHGQQQNRLSNGNSADANHLQHQENQLHQQHHNVPEYSRLEYVGVLDYFTFRLEDDDRSKRVTTLEIAASKQIVYVGTEGGNLYQVPLDKFEQIKQVQQQTNKLAGSVQRETGIRPILEDVKEESTDESNNKPMNVDEETTAVNLNDEPHIDEHENVEPFEMIKFDEDVANQLGDDVKPKKQGAIESIKKHPASSDKLLVSYHRGLNVVYDIKLKEVDKYFYHNQILESSCFASSHNGDQFYTSHNDGSYIRWDTKKGSQAKADDDFIGQLYGPYPCKPTPKIQACTGLVNDQTEELIIFSGGMPRATYDDKNPVTIVRTEPDGKDTIKTVLDFTSKVLDFVVITRPRGNLGAGAKSTGGGHGGGGGGGGKKNKNKQQQQQQQQRNQPIAVALAILAEEEFAVIDLLNSESYLEFPLPYLNCVQPSAITCNQHYSDISDELYEQLLNFNKQQLKGKLSQNEWPITGGKVINAPEVRSHDILLTGHEDGSINIWDVSELSMRHLLNLPTARFFSTEDDDLAPIDDPTDDNNSPNNSNEQQQDDSSAWPPLKRIGRFDPFSDDTRLAIRKISLCPQSGTLLVAGTGGQVLVFEFKHEAGELAKLVGDQVTIVSDQRFTWKGRDKLSVRPGVHKFEPGYQLTSYVQLNPPAAATSTDLRADWHLIAVGTSYGFLLYDYVAKQALVNKCTLNAQDFAIVSGDAGAMSRKKSFRKSLRESFRRLRRGRSQRGQPPATQQLSATATSSGGLGTASPDSAGGSGAGAGAGAGGMKGPFGGGGRTTTGVRTLNSPLAAGSNDTAQQAAAAHRNLHSGERQVEPKVELTSIIKCITLTSAVILNTSPNQFKPSLWVGTNSGHVLVYAIELNSEQSATGGGDVAVPAPATTTTSSSSPSSSEQVATTTSSGDSQQQTSNEASSSSQATARTSSARLIKEIQLKHKAPIIAIFTSPEAPAETQPKSATGNESINSGSVSSTPQKQASELFNSNSNKSSVSVGGGGDQAERKSLTAESEANEAPPPPPPPPVVVADKSPSKSQSGKEQYPQARVLVCSEEQFKVFNLPQFKPFCKFKLTAHEGLRAKKISITQFLKPAMATPTPTMATATSVASSTSNKLPSSNSSLSLSRSSQSFATQTSPAASPVPPATDSEEQQESSSTATANGAQTSSSKQAENNNNSLSTLNNNHHHNLLSSGGTKSQDQKVLLNAKFGAKATSSSSSTTSSPDKTATTINAQDYDATSQAAIFEPYMVCMSNQGDCAIYSVPDLKRQAQIQVCKREDVNGITSAMLTNYGEGYYLKSSSNFLRFSISTQRVLRVLSVV